MLSDHIKQDIVLAFQTGGCLLLHESSRESFLHYFHSAISNHLSEKPELYLVLYGHRGHLGYISMSPEWMVT